MKKLSINNIRCIRLEDQLKKVQFIIRDGDNVWIVEALNARLLTPQEKASDIDKPDSL